MTTLYRGAAIQMASGSHVGANLQEAARLIGDAVALGASLIVLPENFALMGLHETDAWAIRETLGKGPLQEFLSQQAARYRIWLVGGTIPLVAQNDNKIKAACLLFDDKGLCIARYDKMHLFDVTVSPNESHHESATVEAGQQVIVVDTPLGKLGLAVCYDVRFPELFRCMLNQGVDVIALPSAFTAITGKAHWEVLVRARAIENLCYVVAANQGGFHINGRETFGESMVVDPWGMIMGHLPRGSGVICGEIDLERQSALRHSFPTINHRHIQCQAP